MRRAIGAVAAVGLALAPAGGWAQGPGSVRTGPVGPIVATAPARTAIDGFLKRARPLPSPDKNGSGLPFIKFSRATAVPWAAIVVMANAAAMKGWTPLTNGATLGGAAVVRTDKGVRVVVRAQDNRLYATTIDGMNPGGPIDGAAWMQTGQTATSEPFCEPSEMADSPEMLCAFLGAGGAAKVAWFNGDYSSAATDLGGHDAGARPTVAPHPQKFACQCDTAGQHADAAATVDIHTEYVWDGGKRLFARNTFTHTVFGYYQPTVVTNLAETFTPGSSSWRQVAGQFDSPVGCDDQYLAGNWTVTCAVVAGKSLATFKPGDLSFDKPIGRVIGKPAPVALSNRTAPMLFQTGGYTPVAIARGVDGRVYRLLGGKWFDEGGAARDGAQISCIANNEQPTCFIQGPDGRIWWKKLGTAAGL